MSRQSTETQVCILVHLQADQQRKRFTTQVVSLNSCDMLLAVLVYMQKQKKCSHKAWHIHIEIISNGCSRISFKDTQRKKAPLCKTPALLESMNMDNWVVGPSNQLFIIGSYTETKLSKK